MTQFAELHRNSFFPASPQAFVIENLSCTVDVSMYDCEVGKRNDRDCPIVKDVPESGVMVMSLWRADARAFCDA